MINNPSRPCMCRERVVSQGGWHSYGCSRKAWKDGYCKQHHPDTVAERRAKSEARYAAKRKRDPWSILSRVVEFVQDETISASYPPVSRQYRMALLDILNGKESKRGAA